MYDDEGFREVYLGEFAANSSVDLELDWRLVCGCDMLISKAVFFKLGKTFFQYLREDLIEELCWEILHSLAERVSHV